jgi:pre-mRNA 3'-end-processing factor FIP1
MPEDQITALPPEVRAMVMTGATSLMSSGAMPHGAPQMMGVGVGGPGPMMHPHEMGLMGVMNGGDMQQAASMMQGPLPEGDVMGIQGLGQEGFQQNVPGPGQMMGMGQEYGMQVNPTFGSPCLL